MTSSRTSGPWEHFRSAFVSPSSHYSSDFSKCGWGLQPSFPSVLLGRHSNGPNYWREGILYLFAVSKCKIRWKHRHIYASEHLHVEGRKMFDSTVTSWSLNWLSRIFIFLLLISRWGWRLPPPATECGLPWRSHWPQSGRESDVPGEWAFSGPGM